jgi:hypothetical protein
VGLVQVLRQLLTQSQGPALSPDQAEADKWLHEFKQAYQTGDLDHAAGALTQLRALLHKSLPSNPR